MVFLKRCLPSASVILYSRAGSAPPYLQSSRRVVPRSRFAGHVFIVALRRAFRGRWLRTLPTPSGRGVPPLLNVLMFNRLEIKGMAAFSSALSWRFSEILLAFLLAVCDVFRKPLESGLELRHLRYPEKPRCAGEIRGHPEYFRAWYV